MANAQINFLSPRFEGFYEKSLQGSRNLTWKEVCDIFIAEVENGKTILDVNERRALGKPSWECKPLPLHSEELLYAIMDTAAPQVAVIRELMKKIGELNLDNDYSGERRAKLQQRIDFLKKRLPAVSFMADFKGKPRKAENAHATGLVLIDIDHMEGDPREVYEEKLRDLETMLGIVFIQISPRGHGLHLVLKGVPGMDIATQQRIFAEATGLEVDTKCKDFSRICFMSGREDVLCLDWEGMQQRYFEAVPEIYREIEEKLQPSEPIKPTLMAAGSGELWKLYEAFFKKHGFPWVGDRNNMLFKATCCVRYASNDFFALKQAVMPFANGLPEREVEEAIKSALKQADNDANKGELQKLQRGISEHIQEEDEEKPNSIEQELEKLEQNLPWLPPVIKQEVGRFPAALKPAAICTCLPVLGTLTTNVQAKYRNDEDHTTSFQVIVEGGSGSNKSSMANKIVDSLWEVQQAYEDREREKQERHNEELQAKGGVEAIKTKADYAPRRVGITSSITQICRIIKNNKGRHIFAFGNEIDDLYGSAKRGFTDKTRLLREAFDNTVYTQDFGSEKSFSGTVKLFFNTLFLGTPGAVLKYIKAQNSSNGTAQRLLFARTPEECEEEIQPLPEVEHQFILNYLRKFAEEVGTSEKTLERKTVELTWLKEEMSQWCKLQKKIEAETLVLNRGSLSHRAAVYGFRAGLLAMALLGLEKTEELDENLKNNISEWAHWVANYTLCGQLLHGVGSEDDRAELRQRAPRPMPQLFKMMPNSEEFNTNDIAEAAKQLKFKTKASRIAEKWRNAKLIEVVRKGVYRKIG